MPIHNFDTNQEFDVEAFQRRRAEKRSAFRRLSCRTEADGWRFANPPYGRALPICFI